VGSNDTYFGPRESWRLQISGGLCTHPVGAELYVALLTTFLLKWVRFSPITKANNSLLTHHIYNYDRFLVVDCGNGIYTTGKCLDTWVCPIAGLEVKCCLLDLSWREGAWCWCWCVEPRHPLLWILVWYSTLWSQKAFWHIQTVNFYHNQCYSFHGETRCCLFV
jgi:hypothetical protein